MVKGFIFAVGAVLALWFVAVCNRVPLFTITLPTVTSIPYGYPEPREKERNQYAPIPYGYPEPREKERNQYAPCLADYVVGAGETQWHVADLYAGGEEKSQWLRQMRRASHLATDDDHLYPGQVLCVEW